MVNLAEILRLERPLAILDLETTGFDPNRDRIVQIGLTIHYPHREPIAWESLIDPEGVPISQGAIDTHHITPEMIVGKPTFRQIAPALAPKLINVDIGGYSVTFDIGFTRAEMKRVGVDWPWQGHLIDALAIYRRLKPHTLQNAYKEYVNKDGFAGAHDAGSDVSATEETLAGQLMQNIKLPRTVKELSEYCFPNKAKGLDNRGKLEWLGDRCCFTFGKYKGRSLQEVRAIDSGYLIWVTNGDFEEDFKAMIRMALDNAFPVKP